MEEFVACFAEIVDPRQNNARHDLHELLLIALCALMSGGEDCSDMALFGKIVITHGVGQVLKLTVPLRAFLMA
jgi:hypothetical protein